jgi:predicted GIY-YIG superfamily endonuclease
MTAHDAPPPRPSTLYRFFDHAGALLYVGVAGNPGRRWEQHAKAKSWWATVATTTVEHFASRDEALAAEREAIANERPLHNVAGTSPRAAKPPVTRRKRTSQRAVRTRADVERARREREAQVTARLHERDAAMSQAERTAVAEMARRLVERTRTEQGLPAQLEDPVVAARIARILSRSRA